MKGRKLAISLVSAMLLVVLALCGLTAFGTYRWAQASGLAAIRVRHDDVSAQVTETRAFPAGQGLALEVNNRMGDVTVSAVPGIKEVTIQVTRTGWGANEAEAKAAAAKLIVDLRQEGSKVSASFTPAEDNQLTIGTYRLPSASFNIQVPPETSVTLTARAGDLSLSGTRGKAVLDCAFGKLTVRDVQGEQSINGQNASLDLNNLQAGDAPISIQTSFGELTAQAIRAGKVTVENANGAVTLSGVQAADSLSVKSSFAAIQLTDVTSAGLEINNQNGEVKLAKSTIHGPLKVETSFGAIDLSEAQADGYTLTNQNGEILLDGAQGSLALNTSFAEIRVSHAQDAVLKITNQNGKVSFSGSLDAKADQSIETSFDEIVVALPASTAANLDISTSLGEIQSDLPVTLSGGMSNDKWSGKLNGGGPVLKIQNQNAGVKIEALK